jgi:Ca-activated chloride channel homolog
MSCLPFDVLLTAMILLQAQGLPGRPGNAQQVIRADVRLVEVFATVTERGRPVRGLTAADFRVSDNGQPQKIISFGNQSTEMACAIVLDTTGSMNEALPLVKNAVMQLIDKFRPEDSFAVYSFNVRLDVVQEFTSDKTAAKKAVLGLTTGGPTALFDAVLQVTRALDQHKGKMALVVFTDGNDNASALTMASAVERVKKVGVPLYAVAQGEALHKHKLVEQLQFMAATTGGACYEVKKSSQIERVFADISNDLQNTYLLAYEAPAADSPAWRKIEVTTPGLKSAAVRAKLGYYPR